MTLSKILTAALLGIMSFTTGALAGRDLAQSMTLPNGMVIERPASAKKGGSSQNTSSAKCTAVAFGFSKVENDNARAEAAVDVAAYMCGEGDATAEAIAEATASAFALAVADAAVSCDLSGDATGSGNAYAKAEASAQVWLEAYAEAAATAVQCKKCEAFIYGWSYIGQEVFLKAVAEAKASIDATANGGDVLASIHATQVTIDKAVVTAYAEALAGAKAVYDTHECAAYGTSEGCVFTEEHPEGECVECVMTAVSFGQITEIDAIADASAGAGAYTCGKKAVAYADTSVTAKALAHAMAVAVSYVHVSCESAEGGYACADVGTHIQTSAKAVAEAYANAWAGAVACDECKVNVDAAVSSIETILVEAATSAYASVCVAEGTAWTVSGLAVEIESGYLVALAKAVALAFSSKPPAVCAAAVTVATYVGP